MMGNEERKLAPMEAFRQRVEAKVRDDIAGMLPDEVIAEMVTNAAAKLLVEKRLVRPADRYRGAQYAECNWLEELVREVAEPAIRKAVDRFMEERAEEMAKLVEEELRKIGPRMLVAQVQAVTSISAAISSLESSVMTLSQRY